MKKNDFLSRVHELFRETAIPHTPEGSEVQAVIDQWTHALATASAFFYNPELAQASTLRQELIDKLLSQGLYSGRERFFSNVFSEIVLKPYSSKKFTFIDLFAGVGGIRLGFQEHGGTCIFSSEYDKSAQKTYKKNHGETPFGDITKISQSSIPDHDFLLAGFPCQPFSRAGVSARSSIGQEHGFLCESQGTLFFDVMRIAFQKKPKIIFLENVRNILSHDSGNTFKVIQNSIENLGYHFSYEIINSNSLVPQNRVRCYMVGVRKDVGEKFKFPTIKGDPLPLKSILEDDPDDIYTISDKLWAGHIQRTNRNIARGTGFTAFTADLDKPSNTIVARYGKDGKECLIPQEGKNPRLLTKREAARIQGFPECFILPETRTPTYKQFGNSVTVPVISKIAKKIVDDIL